MNDAAPKPWYRQFWPWVLLGLPATAVVAGIATVFIAAGHRDSLVADDYYRQGLAINRRLARLERAAALGVSARLRVDPGPPARLQVTLEGPGRPETLRLAFSHPTLAAEDRDYVLRPAAGGTVYETKRLLPPAGRWYVSLEPAGGEWRLTGELRLPLKAPAVLHPAAGSAAAGSDVERETTP